MEEKLVLTFGQHVALLAKLTCLLLDDLYKGQL